MMLSNLSRRSVLGTSRRGRSIPQRQVRDFVISDHGQRTIWMSSSSMVGLSLSLNSRRRPQDAHYDNKYTSISRRFFHDNDKEDDRLLVVGTGVAGCAAALVAAETYRVPVTMLCAGAVPTDCNSYWAQGGIIYRGKENNHGSAVGDSPDLLAFDIERAGAGLCQSDAVQKVATEGPARVEELLLDRHGGPFANVPFERDATTGELKLTLEASHSAPRILYYADHTGKKITEHITQAAMRHPLIHVQPNTIVTDLMVADDMCVGVEALASSSSLQEQQQQQQFKASRGVVLASGGLAGIYQHSTNPPGFNALGSSVALAQRAGATLRDMEYVQFHPTALFRPNEARFLLTEALRGEGAILRNSSGEAFARNFHAELGELAPRDIVARGVYAEAQRTNDQVYLDITHRPPEFLEKRFPSIQEYLKQRGMDMTTQAMPITPAAHYTCGGIATNLRGETSLAGLYAAGEAARTGLHGGNRLASTSLLEGLVFGATVADTACGIVDGTDRQEEAKRILSTFKEKSETKSHPSSRATRSIPADTATVLLDTLKRTMWDHVGLVRTPMGLTHAKAVLDDIHQEAEVLLLQAKYCEDPLTKDLVALRDAAVAGQVVASAAAANPVSAGTHYVVADAEEAEDEEDQELMTASAR